MNMNINNQEVNNETTLVTPDPQRSWLKTRSNARRTRNPTPDPPVSPSPQPRTTKRLKALSPAWTLRYGPVPSYPGEDVSIPSSCLPDGAVKAIDHLAGEDINDPDHDSLGNTVQFDDRNAGEDMADPNVHLGIDTTREGHITPSYNAAPFTHFVSALIPLQSILLGQVHQASNNRPLQPGATMLKRKRVSSPGCIFPQTMEDAFSRATPAFISRNNAVNDGRSPTQYTFETQTQHNPVHRPILETETSQGPVLNSFSDAGLILQQPLDTSVLAPTMNNGRTPEVQSSVPRPAALNNGRTPQIQNTIPQRTAMSDGRPPEGHISIPRKLPPLAPKPLPVQVPTNFDSPLSTLSSLHRPLQIGDRVHLLSDNNSSSGATIYMINNISPAGTYTITPIPAPIECPDPNRLLRCPLQLGDVVCVYQHTVETGSVNGTSIGGDGDGDGRQQQQQQYEQSLGSGLRFGLVKIGWGAVCKMYVVDGRRKFDVKSGDSVYAGCVFEGVDESEIGLIGQGSSVVVPGGVMNENRDTNGFEDGFHEEQDHTGGYFAPVGLAHPPCDDHHSDYEAADENDSLGRQLQTTVDDDVSVDEHHPGPEFPYAGYFGIGDYHLGDPVVGNPPF